MGSPVIVIGTLGLLDQVLVLGGKKSAVLTTAPKLQGTQNSLPPPPESKIEL